MKGSPKSSTHTGWKGTLIVSLFIYFFISPYHALHRSTSPENRNKRTQVNPPFLLLLFRRLATFAFIFGGRFFFGEILDFFLAMNGDWLIFFYFLGLFFLRRTTAYQSRNPCTGWRLNVENVKKKTNKGRREIIFSFIRVLLGFLFVVFFFNSFPRNPRPSATPCPRRAWLCMAHRISATLWRWHWPNPTEFRWFTEFFFWGGEVFFCITFGPALPSSIIAQQNLIQCSHRCID